MARARRGGRATVFGVVLGVTALVGWFVLHRGATITSACTAVAGADRYTVDPEQARNATTIAAEAHRQGLPAHAVSVGLAAAMQESKLRNLPYGDRDSLGLFQQRPSQGWGTPAELMQPRYAAAAFFRGLRKVHGWQQLPIYQAAQRVQRSADAAAYATWDTEARTIARGLTGESPAGFGCRFPSVPRASSLTGGQLRAAAVDGLGVDAFAPDPAPSHGWLVASWVMTRAQEYSVSRISFGGSTWTPREGWHRDTHPRPAGVSYSLQTSG